MFYSYSLVIEWNKCKKWNEHEMTNEEMRSIGQNVSVWISQEWNILFTENTLDWCKRQRCVCTTLYAIKWRCLLSTVFYFHVKLETLCRSTYRFLYGSAFFLIKFNTSNMGRKTWMLLMCACWTNLEFDEMFLHTV